MTRRETWTSARSTATTPEVSENSVLRDEPERFGELACCLPIGELSCVRFRDHHQVPRRQIGSPVAKHLSQKPLDTIALNRVSHAGAHGDAEPWPLHLAGPTNEDQVRSMTARSEEHTSELQSLRHLVCRLLLEKKK